MKLKFNPIDKYQAIIKKPLTSDELMYILDCSTPQENILKNSDFFTHTNLRMRFLVRYLSEFIHKLLDTNM